MKSYEGLRDVLIFWEFPILTDAPSGGRTYTKSKNGLRRAHRPFVYLEPKWLRTTDEGQKGAGRVWRGGQPGGSPPCDVQNPSPRTMKSAKNVILRLRVPNCALCVYIIICLYWKNWDAERPKKRDRRRAGDVGKCLRRSCFRTRIFRSCPAIVSRPKLGRAFSK